jgi:Zn-dependent M28 family amino/carboxypeptidase
MVAIIFFILTGSILTYPVSKNGFSNLNSFSLLAKLQSFGPRIPGSDAHIRSREFIATVLRSYGWTVEIQSSQIQGHPFHNILASQGNGPIDVLFGSHYDSRIVADRDPNALFHKMQVPGANDGGASTTILMELARIIPPENADNLGLVFFDIEDQGNIDGWDWILGSRLFVNQNKELPSKVILLDMIGGFDQKIIPPNNSDPEIYKDIQNYAIKLGYSDQFRSPSQSGILDDHVPFIEKGVPSVDLIDIIDPYWHTTLDDLENVSMQSLQRVGDTLYFWILSLKN